MEALRLYLKQQGEGLEMQNQCAEIKLRAERKAGELLGEMGKNKGTQGQLNGRGVIGGNGTDTANKYDIPTLSDIGLTKRQSSRFQLIASLPAPDFEAEIAATIARSQELTTSRIGSGAVAAEIIGAI